MKIEDAIKRYESWVEDDRIDVLIRKEHRQVADWLKELKTDRPQGEWIRDKYWSRGTGMGEEYGFFYKCSLCEYEVENGYTKCGFNFCPNCGADMRKGADDETEMF